jgi:iron(III) transport system ATP-binding protein
MARVWLRPRKVCDPVMASLEIERATKAFGATLAVDGVDLQVASGAFVALLGPSGCGKTTLLRLIAGLERPTNGRIRIGARDMADGALFVEPEDRGLGMVFQSYALWPHMTVRQNVEFGLKTRRRPKSERRRRAEDALAMVGLVDHASRRPSELSGGQRQRVALARCLALDPPLILLDEPLASLDVHLRQTMQREFRRLHRDSGRTFVYVTHEHSEALALANHVAVMDRGRLQQFASPQDLYRRPANAMVAGFIGGASLAHVEVLAVDSDERRVVLLGETRMILPGAAPPGPGLVCLRPEDVELVPDGKEDGGPILLGRVIESFYRGDGFDVDVALNGKTETVLHACAPRGLDPGSLARIAVRGGWVLPRTADAP